MIGSPRLCVAPRSYSNIQTPRAFTMLLVHFNLTSAPTCSALEVQDLALTFAGGAFDLALNLSVRAVIGNADLADAIAGSTDLGNKTSPVAMTTDDGA